MRTVSHSQSGKCRLTPNWRKAIFKSPIKGLKSQKINRNQSGYA